MTSPTASGQGPESGSPAEPRRKQLPPELQGGGIVRFALIYPRTWIVAALMILFLGAYTYENIPTDIFPNVDIPVVTVIWTYTGLSPK